ncbi:hypothetical protein ACN47E_004105 [Coniothyrium glycines]
MEKIKSVLHGHKKHDDTAHDATQSASATEGQKHPIYNEMTGQTTGQSVSGVSPYSQPKTVSGEPYTALAQPGSSTHGQAQHVGTDGVIGGHSGTTTTHHDNSQSTNQTHAKNGGEASIVPLKVQEKLPESVERAVPNAIHDTGDNKHSTATGNHSSTTAFAGTRPDANPTGSANHAEQMSTASIKSGVIGFGPESSQGHAAISTHNPTEEYLQRDQVLGGGQPGTAGQTKGQELPGTGIQPHAQSTSSDQPRTANLSQISEDRPYDNTLRQESYTPDTTRSFPLSGGVTSQPHDEHSLTTRHATEHTPVTQSTTQSAAPTSTLHQQSTSAKGPITTGNEAETRDNHGREALAGAAAAAAGVGASQAYASRDKDTQQPGHTSSTSTAGHNSTTSHNQPTEDEGLLAKGKRLIGLGGHKNEAHTTHSDHHDRDGVNTTAPLSTQTAGTTTHTGDHHPDALAAALAAASNTTGHSASATGIDHGADRGLPSTSANPSGTGVTSGERPQGQRLESHHRHVPGEFITTPHEHAGNTYLDYTTVVEPPAGTHHNISQSSTSGPSSIAHSSAAPVSSLENSSTVGTGAEPSTANTQHELRHTGTLDDPQSKSSDEHHLGRNVAIAGGLAGAATGLGAAASHSQHSGNAQSDKPLYEESSPYSSKSIDPRVLGTSAPLEQQMVKPTTQSQVSPHPVAQSSSPAGFSSTAPTATTAPTSTQGPIPETSHSDHSPNAGLAAAGLGAGTAGELAGRGKDAPMSTSAANQPSSNVSAPLASSGTAPLASSTGNDQFYGATGAPAPVVDKHVSHSQPTSTLGTTSSTDPSAPSAHDSHLKRDAGLGGAGIAAAGGLYAANRDQAPATSATPSTVDPNQRANSSTEDPASKTTGPHKSNIANILDPRVKPDPSKQKEHTTSGPHQSDALNKLDPRVDEKAGQHGHSYGKDAAVVGGTGAAGYGAYEAARAYGDHRATQPGAAMSDQRYDPSATTGAPNPIPTKSEYDYNNPAVQSNLNRAGELETQDHSHRNAALGTGAGIATAGAAGAAYAISRPGENTQDLPVHEKQTLGSSTQPPSVSQSTYPSQPLGSTVHPTTQSSAYSTQTTAAPGTATTHDPTKDNTESHTGRNAALLGGGAAVAGAGAYALSQQDEREKARLAEREQELAKKQAHDAEREQHHLDKEHAKEQHKLDKAEAKHDKEVKKHDAAVASHAKEEKKVAKEHEKEEKRLEKEEAKRQKEAEKEAEGEKKKGGLLGFLHRDKSKKEKSTSSPESSPRQSREYSPRHSKEYAAGTGALGVGTTAAAYGDDHPDSPRYKAHNLLHKDPPKGHPAREALEHPTQSTSTALSGKREHIGVDGPIGDPNAISGDRETRHGVYGAHPADDLLKDHTVIEPRTGLPMNVGRYGEGAGGTDGNTAIHGVQQHHGAAGTTGTGLAGSTGAPGETRTDWDGVRKADTPY